MEDIVLDQIQKLWFGLGLGFATHVTLWLTFLPVHIFWRGTTAALRTLPRPADD